MAIIIMPGAIFIALCRMAPFIWTVLPPIFFPVLDMTIDADTVDNEYSFITAGHDLDLAADSLTNIGYKNIKRTNRDRD